MPASYIVRARRELAALANSRAISAALRGSERTGAYFVRHRLTTLVSLALAGALLPLIADGIVGSADAPSHTFTVTASFFVAAYLWFVLVAWHRAGKAAGAGGQPLRGDRGWRWRLRAELSGLSARLGSEVWEQKLSAFSEGFATLGVFAVAIASVAALVGFAFSWPDPGALNQTRLLGGVLLFLGAVLLLGSRLKQRESARVTDTDTSVDRLSYDRC